MKTLTLLTMLTLSACGQPANQAAADFTGGGKADGESDDLRILGAIPEGGIWSEIPYQPSPPYWAISFHGTAGTGADVWVHSLDGNSEAWILDADRQILAYNDDADPTTSDAHVATTLPGSPGNLYYIVFAETHGQAAHMLVELSGTCADCATSSDWDGSACAGAPLTDSGARMLAAATGTNPVGHYRIRVRKHACEIDTGVCDPWSEVPTSELPWAAIAAGDLTLVPEPREPDMLSFALWAAGKQVSTCSEIDGLNEQCWGMTFGYTNPYSGITTPVSALVGGSDISPKGLATDHCFWMTQTIEEDLPDLVYDDYYQVVLIGDY